MKIQMKSLGRKKYLLLIPAILLIFTPVLLTLQSASAIASSDGLFFYGAASNTNPQTRAYTNPDNFGSAANTVNGTQALTSSLKVSPTRHEAIAGYVNSSGVLQVMCYNGASWSNEWTVTVGGTGTTKAFDIEYEKTSGDVMVLYGNNGASLGYRTKLGSTGCGAANWASASTFTPARTTGTIQWVKLASNQVGSTNRLAAVWADNNTTGTTGGDLSAQIWTGTAWGNEPSAALETDMEFASAAQDTDSFDLEFEGVSGDLQIVWGKRGADVAGLIWYMECRGNTNTCTWATSAGTGIATTIPTVVDAATSIDLAVRPGSNSMSLAAMDNGQAADSCDGSGGVWNGTTWFGISAFDTSSECPSAGQKTVSTFWLVNGANARWIIVYDDASDTGISWVSFNSTTGTGQTDHPSSISDVRGRFDSAINPFNNSEAMVTVTGSTGALYAKRLSMASDGTTFTWSNADGGTSLGTAAQSAVGDFTFAYWRYIPNPSYTQSAYRWYANADSTAPGSALANENTAHVLTSLASPIRLRTQLTVGTDDLQAGTQAFKLQFATATSGPWKDPAGQQDAWCNDTTGVSCTTSWTARRKITMNNSASTENLSNFPLLVKVNSSRIDYSKTQAAGQDLRFVDASDPNTALPYEIESWNESGDSYVWVKVPQINSNSSADYIWMYYGNASASDGQDVANVWDTNYKVVQHLKETSACPVTFVDSTSTGNNGACTNSGPAVYTTGKIDGGRDFDGTDDYIEIADSPSQDMTNGTYETWVNRDAIGSYHWLMEKGQEDDDSFSFFVSNTNRLGFSYRDTEFDRNSATDTTTTIAAGTWYRVAAVFDDTNNIVRLYINGNQVFSQADTNTPMVAPGGVHIGAEYFGGGASTPLNGKMDEVRISNSVRSGEWLEADYLSQNDTMNTFDSEQDQSSLAPAWNFYNNASVSSGATLAASLLTGTDVFGTYQEANPTPVNPNAVTTGQQVEWDFALDPAGAANGVTYYFRMVKSDGTALGAYTYYPEITITLPGGPTLDQQMRGGQGVVNGAKSPFTF